MQTRNRLLDDLARVTTGAFGVAAGMREEFESRLREQFERILAKMDLVTREEFEVVRAMAAKARDEQERLTERVAALEAGGARAARAPRRRGKTRSAPTTTPKGGADDTDA